MVEEQQDQEEEHRDVEKEEGSENGHLVEDFYHDPCQYLKYFYAVAPV